MDLKKKERYGDFFNEDITILKGWKFLNMNFKDEDLFILKGKIIFSRKDPRIKNCSFKRDVDFSR